MTSKIPVSVIVITKNEERNIAKCLRTVDAFDEVFVVDSMSTDKTRQIAADMGAHVIEFRWNGKYPKKKQWCLENLPFRHDWVLYVDADEEVYPELAEEIRGLAMKGPVCAGYFVSYDYVFMGRVLKHGQRVHKLVFLDRTKARFIPQDDLGIRSTYDEEFHTQPKINGQVCLLESRMLHNDHDSLHHYMDRHNTYSDWEAILRGRGLPINSGVTHPGMRGKMRKVFEAIPGKPIAMFGYSYVYKAGFLDGWAGLNFALSKAFYYWQISVKTAEVKSKARQPQT
jgi:glycosyltransferase involved in cell wall biosynthesis